MTVQKKIQNNKTYLGIEFGSTRIKAVLIDDTFAPIAAGSHDWENRYENGVWTYSLEDIISGLRDCYASLAADVKEKYGIIPESYGAMGISGMMHGYMAFDENDDLLVPFRTWRNTITEQAASELSQLFKFNIPQRWSIAHLYQAILNNEEHISKISHINTLAGYIHYLLTGERSVGVGEASGIFPIENGTYNAKYMEKLDTLLKEKNFDGDIREILPAVLSAGEGNAALTESGAKLLDPTGVLKAGVKLCPPEGDAGTGMVATDSVLPQTGNVSAGTSIFAMLVLSKPLLGYYPEIDVVTTPDGSPVAMVHCNNCCSELDAWVNAFGEFAALCGDPMDKSKLYETLYKNAQNGDPDCGGTVAYNFLSGEPVAGAENGRPMYFRTPDGKFSLANFFRAQLYSSMAALKLGMDILFENEKVSVQKITGHGGLFKVQGVAQQFLADGLNSAVSVMKTAAEGGAWGMAVLAAYAALGNGRSLPEFLETEVFASMESVTVQPDEKGVAGFAAFIENYKKGLSAEYAAAK
ncbi:MAG: FGGY-family carbohydrate kinase [Oscillospiraceae bacterium]|nr:FGGY-family carbohydrate kinase [Oscillospiraceae bacterium]